MASLGTIKKVAKISKITGFTSLCYRLNKNRKRTIAYHNIIPDKYFDDSLHLSHSMKESSFIKQLEVIKDKLGITLNIYDTNKATITFDDGYLNQYSVASKIMNDKDIQGYFFCTANVINDNEAFIMDRLQYWFSYVPEGVYNLDEINIVLNIKDKESRKIEWQKISDIIGPIEIERIEKLLDDKYPFRDISINNEFWSLRFRGISKIQLKEMKEKGHKIGAHSANHKRLSIMDELELKKDIDMCGSMLYKTYNTNIFCYPFGSIVDIDENVLKNIKDNGFNGAFAYSNNPIKEGYNEYFMPRMFLPDTDDADIISFVLSGAKHFISFRKLLPKI